jgi:hypothetical protein
VPEKLGSIFLGKKMFINKVDEEGVLNFLHESFFMKA